MRNDLTIHCVVRNEPFVYYAVKAIYELATIILLYDTGSYDNHTLEDIQTLIEEDSDNKIVFKELEIDADGTKWTTKSEGSEEWRKERQKKQKFGIGHVRQMQIDVTKTKYFMVLDGDEIHYAEALMQINYHLDNWPEDKVCGSIGRAWFCEKDKVFRNDRAGRLFLTDSVDMATESFPHEIHRVAATKDRLRIGHPSMFSTLVKTMAHYEAFVKPWRRYTNTHGALQFGEIPEIILGNDSYLRRFESELSSSS